MQKGFGELMNNVNYLSNQRIHILGEDNIIKEDIKRLYKENKNIKGIIQNGKEKEQTDNEQLKFLQENINKLINRLNGLSNDRNLLVEEIKKNKMDINRLNNENNSIKESNETKEKSKKNIYVMKIVRL